MLGKEHRLRAERDFQRLAMKGRSVFGPFFTLRVRESKEKTPKIGFITSTKAMKLSVDRNRAKRKLRHILRELVAEVPGNVHLLFVIKPEVVTMPHAALVDEVRRVIGKIPSALLQPAKMSPGAIKRLEKRGKKKISP